jgi:hypothetical protein
MYQKEKRRILKDYQQLKIKNHFRAKLDFGK